MSETFRPGEPVILVDRKERRYFVVLAEGGKTNLRGHVLMHDDLIGQAAGLRVRSSREELFVVVRPNLADLVLEMPRSATIIYPKDLGTILVWGDLRPGLSVVEAGIGTGALAIAVLRAIGHEGRLVSYEVRPDVPNLARKNIRLAFDGIDPLNHDVRIQSIYEGIEERDVDRVLLDVPEPWHVVPHAADAMRIGGVFMAYSPTIIQVKETVDALHRSRAFGVIETSETMMRPWHVTRNSIRPELRMVGHTGFLTFARRVLGELPPQTEGEQGLVKDDQGADEDGT